MFSESEQAAIQEKVEQLRKIKYEKMSAGELAALITQRRVSWMEEKLEVMLKKYHGLSPEEQSYRIVFFEHMGINPGHSRMTRIFPGKIRIESYNFFPYLEACMQLKLDTKFVCSVIGEPSIQETTKLINSKLRFGRDYNNIRPYNGHFCEEFFEVL